MHTEFTDRSTSEETLSLNNLKLSGSWLSIFNAKTQRRKEMNWDS